MTATPRSRSAATTSCSRRRLGERQARGRLVHDEQRGRRARAPSRSRRAAAARSTARPAACPARRRGRADRGTAARSRASSRRSISRSAPQRVGSRPSRTLPATSRLSSRFSSWWMNAIPSAVAVWTSRIDDAARRRSAPRRRRAARSPPTIFISVDLPAPFSPSSATTSPACTSRLTPRSACTPGNRLWMPRSWRSGAAAIGAALSGRGAARASS